jgi:hypothetical protein
MMDSSDAASLAELNIIFFFARHATDTQAVVSVSDMDTLGF